MEQLVEVYTMGAKKYAPRNWEKGMPWSSVMSSLKRHIAQFEKGEDYDQESGLLHMAHASWNAMALTSYYKIAPHFDDRPHKYLRPRRIGLDIDDVLADWVGPWCKLHGREDRPTAWNFDRDIKDKFDTLKSDDKLEDFYAGLPVKSKPEDMSFEPVVYVTARPVSSEITQKWLDDHGFPVAPVETVGLGGSKLDVLKKYNVDTYVDDSYANFVQLNNAGIFTYLFDAPHNARYDVGAKRIKSLRGV